MSTWKSGYLLEWSTLRYYYVYHFMNSSNMTICHIPQTKMHEILSYNLLFLGLSPTLFITSKKQGFTRYGIRNRVSLCGQSLFGPSTLTWNLKYLGALIVFWFAIKWLVRMRLGWSNQPLIWEAHLKSQSGNIIFNSEIEMLSMLGFI